MWYFLRGKRLMARKKREEAKLLGKEIYSGQHFSEVINEL